MHYISFVRQQTTARHLHQQTTFNRIELSRVKAKDKEIVKLHVTAVHI